MSIRQNVRLTASIASACSGILFMGNEKLASGVTESGVILQSLIDDDQEIHAVVLTGLGKQQSRSKQHPAVTEIAKQYGIPVERVNTSEELLGMIAKYQPALGVLAAFGMIIPQTILNQFPLGIINIHPSLLPAYRGSSPIERTILDGLTHTGVSLMKLTAGMDEGPILDTAELEISSDIYKQTLTDHLSERGAEILIDNLPDILTGHGKYTDQKGEVSTTSKIDKSDSVIDWNKPALDVEREIRAYAGWPGSKTMLNDVEVTIINAGIIYNNGETGKVFRPSKSRLAVYCADKALEITRLKPTGKQEISAASFINGYLK